MPQHNPKTTPPYESGASYANNPTKKIDIFWAITWIIIATILLLFLMYPEYRDQSINALEKAVMDTSVAKNIVNAPIFRDVIGVHRPDFSYWSSGYLTYYIGAECNAQKKQNIQHAFDIITTKTEGLVTFTESTSGDIEIMCHDRTAGYSGLTTVWLYSDGHIESATIDYYKLGANQVECATYPRLEVHETLHALGFEDDFGTVGSIMWYPRDGSYWNPCIEMEDRIAGCLINVYSDSKNGTSCAGIIHK